MKLLFDTTVYIHCLRSRTSFDQFQAEYQPRRPQIWLSADDFTLIRRLIPFSLELLVEPTR